MERSKERIVGKIISGFMQWCETGNFCLIANFSWIGKDVKRNNLEEMIKIPRKNFEETYRFRINNIEEKHTL